GRRHNDPSGLAASLNAQARIRLDAGELDEAMRLLKAQEELHRRLNDPNGLAIALANQAELIGMKRSRPSEGLPLAEEALRLAKDHGLMRTAEQIEAVVEEIRGLMK